MIKIIYRIVPEKKQSEMEWLRVRKICPSMMDTYNWTTNQMMVLVGVIVSPEEAVLIKLRHNLDSQQEYKQK